MMNIILTAVTDNMAYKLVIFTGGENIELIKYKINR